jgi:predicted site-specific integrase-resolvase
MTRLTLKEALDIFQEHHITIDDIRINEQIMEEWLRSGEIQGVQERDGGWKVSEDEIYRYIYSLQWEGTAYEEGIDDKTRIDRLYKEVYELRKQIRELQQENYELRVKLGVSDL